MFTLVKKNKQQRYETAESRRKKLQKSLSRLTTYIGEHFKVVGVAQIKCSLKGKPSITEFHLVDTRYTL